MCEIQIRKKDSFVKGQFTHEGKLHRGIPFIRQKERAGIEMRLRADNTGEKTVPVSGHSERGSEVEHDPCPGIYDLAQSVYVRTKSSQGGAAALLPG